MAHGDCVTLDAMGGVSVEVLTVWPPSLHMSHRSWAPPELLYWEPLLCSLIPSFISEVWVAFHKVDSGHRIWLLVTGGAGVGKVVMVLGSFR